MTDRVQLNLRLDGKRELLESIKDVAAAEGMSVNAWVLRTLEQAVINPTVKPETTPPTPALADREPLLDSKLDELLDKKLAAKLEGIEERLGKLRA